MCFQPNSTENALRTSYRALVARAAAHNRRTVRGHCYMVKSVHCGKDPFQDAGDASHATVKPAGRNEAVVNDEARPIRVVPERSKLESPPDRLQVGRI